MLKASVVALTLALAGVGAAITPTTAANSSESSATTESAYLPNAGTTKGKRCKKGYKYSKSKERCVRSKAKGKSKSKSAPKSSAATTGGAGPAPKGSTSAPAAQGRPAPGSATPGGPITLPSGKQ